MYKYRRTNIKYQIATNKYSLSKRQGIPVDESVVICLNVIDSASRLN